MCVSDTTPMRIALNPALHDLFIPLFYHSYPQKKKLRIEPSKRYEDFSADLDAKQKPMNAFAHGLCSPTIGYADTAANGLRTAGSGYGVPVKFNACEEISSLKRVMQLHRKSLRQIGQGSLSRRLI